MVHVPKSTSKDGLFLALDDIRHWLSIANLFLISIKVKRRNCPDYYSCNLSKSNHRGGAVVFFSREIFNGIALSLKIHAFSVSWKVEKRELKKLLNSKRIWRLDVSCV